jgi:hypothetical protein
MNNPQFMAKEVETLDYYWNGKTKDKIKIDRPRNWSSEQGLSERALLYTPC